MSSRPRPYSQSSFKGHLPPYKQQTFWSRLSRTKKIALIAVPVMVALALILGLAIGLTSAQRDSTRTRSSAAAGPAITPAQVANGTLWQPQVGDSWQIVLADAIALPSDAAALSPPVGIYDIDLFAHNASTIATLHQLGARVICYFSAGSYEPGRPDSRQFIDADMGLGLAGWPGERWLDVRSSNVRGIMRSRIELAKRKGCDAIDPDNVDGFQNENGLGLTRDDAVEYVRWMAGVAAERGLSTGLKNAGDVVGGVLDVVQFCVNEQCAKYGECSVFAPFVQAGKPVLRIEYPAGAPGGTVTEEDRKSLCEAQGAQGMSTLLKGNDLDGWVMWCDGTTAVTPTV